MAVAGGSGHGELNGPYDTTKHLSKSEPSQTNDHSSKLFSDSWAKGPSVRQAAFNK